MGFRLLFSPGERRRGSIRSVAAEENSLCAEVELGEMTDCSGDALSSSLRMNNSCKTVSVSESTSCGSSKWEWSNVESTLLSGALEVGSKLVELLGDVEELLVAE